MGQVSNAGKGGILLILIVILILNSGRHLAGRWTSKWQKFEDEDDSRGCTWDPCIGEPQRFSSHGKHKPLITKPFLLDFF